MGYKGGTLRTRLLGGDQPTKQRMVEALESRLEADEAVEYQLTSGGALTHEESGGDTYEKGGGDGGTLLAVTDRKLVFVVDTRSGLETADVPYTDLKDITADSGILKTTLSVQVWGRGTYSFRPSQRDRAEQVVEFITNGSRIWQLVVAALQDARQHISTIETYVSEGRMEEAWEARESAESNLQTARGHIEDAQQRFQVPLGERYERVATELSRTWMEARIERGKCLLDEVTTQTESGAYDAAAACVQRAREHFERALAIDTEEGFGLGSEIQSALSDLEARRETLAARPLDLAERSRERAQAADSPELAVVAWEEALDHYRDALEAAWGTNVEFEGETNALRMQIEWVVANIVHERCRLADRLEARADYYCVAGNAQQARDHFYGAAEQVAMARRLATQYRAGDADALDARLDRIRERAAV